METNVGMQVSFGSTQFQSYFVEFACVSVCFRNDTVLHSSFYARQELDLVEAVAIYED